MVKANSAGKKIVNKQKVDNAAQKEAASLECWNIERECKQDCQTTSSQQLVAQAPPLGPGGRTIVN
jgi:hypothetical protein